VDRRLLLPVWTLQLCVLACSRFVDPSRLRTRSTFLVPESCESCVWLTFSRSCSHHVGVGVFKMRIVDRQVNAIGGLFQAADDNASGIRAHRGLCFVILLLFCICFIVLSRFHKPGSACAVRDTLALHGFHVFYRRR